MSAESAFSPYTKKSQTKVCEKVNDMNYDLETGFHHVSSASSMTQSKAFDYTVDKLLEDSSSTSRRKNDQEVVTSTRQENHTSTVSVPEPSSSSQEDALMKGLYNSSFSLGLLARHLYWIQSQKESSTAEPSSSLTPAMNWNLSSLPDAMCPPHLRKLLFSQGNASASPSSIVIPSSARISRGPRRQRTTFTHEQTLRLEMEYHVSEYISRSKRFQLADLLDLTENQIKIWFQNRRAKDKRIEKAIIEQQYHQHSCHHLRMFMTSTNPPSPTSAVTHDCSTCSYTKHHFDSLTASQYLLLNQRHPEVIPPNSSSLISSNSDGK